MADRHGLDRLRWLLEDDPDFQTVSLPRHHWMSDKEVQIEVAQALIEELHDALEFWSSPHGTISTPPGGLGSRWEPPLG